MAFMKLICKAAVLEKRKHTLMQEKKLAVMLSEASPQEAKSGRKIRTNLIRHKMLDLLKKCANVSEKSPMYKFLYNLRHDGSFENYVLKSVVGFVGGFILTYMFFMFFVFQLNFTFSTATIMCSIFGSVLTIGLAFSYNVRCIVFLTLPQLFSKRGRQALLAYAFILAITGPAKNTLNNMGILSESLACGQEQLKQAVKQILEVVKKPFYAIRDAIKTVVKVVKALVKKIKEILLSIKRVIISILKVIKAVFQFLARAINVCNKELGTPFQRCTRVFEDAIIDCHAKLGPAFSWLCSITYVAKAVCYTVKLLDFICQIVDYIGNSIFGVVVRKLKNFIRHIKTMFYVRIRFSHSFDFETNTSKTIEDVAAGIITEVKERTEGLMKIFDFMSCATSLFFIFMIVRVLYYRYKFLSDERFDNRFITKEFRVIDLRRAQLGKETVLPLNKRERHLYISVRSIRLVKKEKVQLSQTAVVLGIASLKLGTHMIADYALFWVLTLIRRHASFQSSYDGSNIPKIQVTGTGLFSDLLRSIVKAFQPVGINLEIDTVPCLPDPIPPDYDRYVQIASLLVICWVLTIFEPYGLRWRNSVMCFYFPLRAKQRAIWLYNHILRTRSSFLKFIRRQLRRKFGGDKKIEKITCREYIIAFLLRYRICNMILKPMNQIACLLCGEIFREEDKIKPIRCATPGCPGTYCEKCFEDLQNICTICLDPIQYGDLSDVSEEKDSSDDTAGRQAKEQLKEQKKRKKKKPKEKMKIAEWCRKFRRRKDKDSDTDADDATTISSSVYSDSEYTTDTGTDTTTGSYGYQYHKDITQQQPVDVMIATTTDLEKQKIPDYVSMETFHDYHSSDKISSAAATFGSNTHYKPSKDSDASKLSLLHRSKQTVATQISCMMEDQGDKIPLLDLDASTDDETAAGSDTTETTFIETTRKESSKRPKVKKKPVSSSSSETTFIDTPVHAASSKKFSFSDTYDSDSTSYSSIDTDTEIMSRKVRRKGSRYPKHQTITKASTIIAPVPIDVPKLNLDFIGSCKYGCGTDPCTCHSRRTGYFHTESETGRSLRSMVLSGPKDPEKRSSMSSSSEYSVPRITHRETISYLYNSPHSGSAYKKQQRRGIPCHRREWDALSNTTETDLKSYRDKVRGYYAKVGGAAFERRAKGSKTKPTSKLTRFFRRLFKRDSLDSPSASARLTKSFLSESEEAKAPARPLSRAPSHASFRPPTNFQCDRGLTKIFHSVQLLFMGGGASKASKKDKGSVSDDSDSVSVRVPTEPSKKSEIQQKFGWYDSTDSDISELNYSRRKKKGKGKEAAETSWRTIPDSHVGGSGDTVAKQYIRSLEDRFKVDQSTETKYSLKDCGCECPRSIHTVKDCSVNCKDECAVKEKDTSSSCCFCTPPPALHNEDTTTTATTETSTPTSPVSTSHESSQTESSIQMNIDKKRATLDRYSREPPERDQNYDGNYMKPSDVRYAFEHNNCNRCPCKPSPDCKGARPPDYQHNQYQHGSHNSHPLHNPHGPHRTHSPHGIHNPHSAHSPHNPHSSHSPHSPHSPHHMHNVPQYPNQQYSQPYQEYQHFTPPIQSSQSQPSHQAYNKPNYGQNNQQQLRRCMPPSNFERKRTTYDLAKSAENLRQTEHSKMSSHPPPSKTISHSVPEVGKHKPMPKQDTAKSEISENYGYVEYPNPGKYPYEEPNQDREDVHDRNCACDYCHHLHRNYFRNCNCCECRKGPFEELSSFSEESQNVAAQNAKPRNMSLAYQKTDDYPVLVDEIETTISQRNKERVRNTMRQFELLSRQNKALEKPIYDDDEDNDERCNQRHYPRNSSPGYNRCNDRCNAQTRNESSSRPAFATTPFPRSRGYVEKVARHMDPSLTNNTQRYRKFNSEQTNSRWQMDPRTGEWYKVYDDNNYDFQNNYPPLPEPPSQQYREQDPYQKGPPSTGYYNAPPQARSGSPNKHHHYPAHSKSCNCRNCMQHRY